MILNHINLPVADVAATRDFFVKHFGMVQTLEVGKNFLVMLQDEGGMVLNISHFDKNDTSEVQYHRDFHIGFFVETNDDVDQFYAKMTVDTVVEDAPKKREGRYGFYATAPGGIVVEIASLR